MKRFFKFLVIGLLVLFVLAQFYPHPKPNDSGNNTHSISTVHLVPDSVQLLLRTSCYDCHSNSTYYPWYYKIQPVAYWLGNHIDEGKRELNFSEFGNYGISKQFNKLRGIAHEIEDGEMPLTSYTLIHTNASLSDAQKKTITSWAYGLRDSIEAVYPADSLVRKRKN